MLAPSKSNTFNFHAVRKFTTSSTLRVLICTSIRDVGVEDRVGSYVQVHGTRQYMMGTSEYLLNTTNANEGDCSVDIVGIMIDDDPREEHKLSGYSIKPTPDNLWIMPSQASYRGRNVSDMIVYNPSSFRKIPLRNADERFQAKREFENSVLAIANDISADVILSDHWMIKLQHVFKEMPTINIHPAITDLKNQHCRRGKTPTADTLKAAQSQRNVRSGATLHFVNETFDDGAAIVDTDHLRVKPNWTPQELRYENYKQAKNPVALEGLLYLTKN